MRGRLSGRDRRRKLCIMARVGMGHHIFRLGAGRIKVDFGLVDQAAEVKTKLLNSSRSSRFDVYIIV